MIENTTFLLGIGAQKAGTTWLHDYLNSRDEIFMHPLKEVHFFDAKYRKDLCGYFDAHFAKRLKDRVSILESEGILNDVKFNALMYRVLMSKQPEYYKKYFEDHVEATHKLYGEITPSYSMLNKDAFKKIKDEFPNIKIIFLLRDPIERHISAYKMECKLLNKEIDFESDSFMNSLKSSNFLERTNYKKTITTIESIFDKEDIFYNFFENMFNDKETKKLCDFLNIPFKPGKYDTKLNYSISKQSVSQKTKNYIYEECKDIYNFCLDKFGSNLPVEWSSTKDIS